jgi:hypothetical protein
VSFLVSQPISLSLSLYPSIWQLLFSLQTCSVWFRRVLTQRASLGLRVTSFGPPNIGDGTEEEKREKEIEVWNEWASELLHGWLLEGPGTIQRRGGLGGNEASTKNVIAQFCTHCHPAVSSLCHGSSQR